jgi:hypothetical protein
MVVTLLTPIRMGVACNGIMVADTVSYKSRQVQLLKEAHYMVVLDSKAHRNSFRLIK